MTLAVLTLGVASARSDEVTLLAPGITPTKGALEKVIPAFESKTGHKVKITYGSGLGTKEQVAKGPAFARIGHLGSHTRKTSPFSGKRVICAIVYWPRAVPSWADSI